MKNCMPNQQQVICVGFMAIDVVLTDDGVLAPTIGGSAANVCLNLKILGCDPLPVGLIGDDEFGVLITDYLQRKKISLDCLSTSAYVKTPFCIEMLRNSGEAYISHSFRSAFLHPFQRSSRYYAPSEALVRKAILGSQGTKVVYSNKQVNGILESLVERDLFLYYEPDCIDDWTLHHALCERANLVKFNHQQFIDYSNDPFAKCRGALIETFGAEGVVARLAPDTDLLKFCTVGGNSIVDPTGAGDWFSASLISQLVAGEMLSLSAQNIQQAVRIARVSCGFKGATGLSSSTILNEELLSIGAPNVVQISSDPALKYCS